MSDSIAAVAMAGQGIVLVRQDRLEVAHSDNRQNYTSLMLDKDDFIFDSRCLLAIGNVVFIATRKKSRIYRSMDSGHTWNIVEDGVHLNCGYFFISETNGWIFAAGEDGAIYSRDMGDAWNYLRNPFN